MRLLVTAGPTHEYLDAVRFLGNPSTGAMGLAVAEAGRDRGHAVTLVLGPSALPDPAGVTVVRVVSALEMHRAVLERIGSQDAAVMTAAVSDYRPRTRHPSKIKKGEAGITLELIKNPDILQDVGTMGALPALVGFALEAGTRDDALAAARGKLREKRCDLIVLNRPASFGGAEGYEVVLVYPDREVELGRIPKRSLGERLVRFVESKVSGDGQGRGPGGRLQQDTPARGGREDRPPSGA
jgi:phosphopantothenoylcysteine decarboxylase/phosphopantothenate--cysteine ligase